MGTRYTVDKDLRLRRVTRSVRDVALSCLKWLVATVSLAALYYMVSSFFISTEEERRLIRENRTYGKLYPELLEKERLVADVVQDLQFRDNAIYEQIFNAPAPPVDAGSSAMFVFASDSVNDRDIVRYAERKAASLKDVVGRVNENFSRLFAMAASGRSVIPPMKIPVEGLQYAQVGASSGQKLNPFYKVAAHHDGIDLMAGQGTPVLASGDGTVSDVRRSRKGLGNIVEIRHQGGYRTVYAHLEDIVVRKGETVRAGRKLGNVGISGNSFAPHLHYEVWRDSVVMDPVNFFFASLSPEEYMNVAYMAATTGQSMD